MHVTVDITDDATEGFNRRMQVEIPEDRIVNDVNEQLRSLVSTTKIPGFRPGKAPLKLLVHRYGQEARNDVVKKLLYSSLQDALTQENLQLANGPEVKEINADPGKGLTYIAMFDVYPNVDTPAVETLEIRRPVAKVTEDDVDRMMETLRSQCRIWSDADHPATKGDRVTVDFEGVATPKPAGDISTESAFIDADSSAQAASPDTNSSSESAPPRIAKGSGVVVELGAGKTIEGFEDGLMGANAGDERVLEIKFPEEYHNPEWSGRPVTFTIQVRSVESGNPPETDEDFAKHFGIEDGSMDTFRAETRKDMENKLAFALESETHKRVVNALLASNPISELPKNVVMRETNAIVEKKRQEIRRLGVDPDKLKINPADFEQQAHQQITLNLLLGKLMSAGNITVDPNRVRKRIEMTASGYQDSKKMIAWYYDDEERLIPVKMMVLQEQLVEWVLEHANVTEEEASFDALLNPPRESNADATSDSTTASDPDVKANEP